MTTCARCGALLSQWEIPRGVPPGEVTCWCGGVPADQPRTLPNVAYAALCDPEIRRPLKSHDVERLASRRYRGATGYSMNAALSQDRRVCWGGQSLYGLARHGLLPGPRSLAEAAYAVLMAAPRELHVEEVEFVLQQLGYRFNADSLLHHLRGYSSNRWDLTFIIRTWNRVSVPNGREARRAYNHYVRACPTDVGFDEFVTTELAATVNELITERTRRLEGLADSSLTVAGDRIVFG